LLVDAYHMRAADRCQA